MSDAAYEERRRTDIKRLANAIVGDVRIAMGIPDATASDDDDRLMMQVSHRVQAYINHRLGIVPPHEVVRWQEQQRTEGFLR